MLAQASNATGYDNETPRNQQQELKGWGARAKVSFNVCK